MPGPNNRLDLEYLRRAIALAMKGRGDVEPNPMVGCMIVKDGRVIGKGLHERFGGPHAEINALAACRGSPEGATMYVTLEPCCHTDKKTPPCAPRVIAARPRRVVIGTLDPNPEVDGRGAGQIRSAGIHVDVLKLPAARQLIAPFIARVTYQRPYVTLKWAESADGKVAGPGGRRTQISGELSTRAIHELRARSDAILVGINTVMRDDPMLTVRLAEPRRPLVRIVLDSDLRLPTECRLVTTAAEQKVIVYASQAALAGDGTAPRRLRSAGVELRDVPEDSPGRLSLRHVLEDLGRLSITHLLVEPGPTLATSFLQTGDWDRTWVIRSPVRIDDATAPQAAAPPGSPVAREMVGPDELSEFLNPRSRVTFSQEPSADFLLATGSQ